MAMKDSDNIARLEALKPRYERLRDLKIRAEADYERYERDLEKARRDAIEAVGTDDEDEIRRLVLESYERNTAAVNEFEAAIAAAEAAYAEIGEASTDAR